MNVKIKAIQGNDDEMEDLLRSKRKVLLMMQRHNLVLIRRPSGNPVWYLANADSSSMTRIYNVQGGKVIDSLLIGEYVTLRDRLDTHELYVMTQKGKDFRDVKPNRRRYSARGF